MKIEPHIEAMLAQVELRVLYGPQAGSRLPLAPGKYLLGTGDTCEIMLAGPRMRECHAALDFDGEIPSVAPIDGNVYDAQGNEIQGALSLRLGMPVEIGGVWITIDQIESEWPDPEEVAAIAGLATSPSAPLETTSSVEVPTQSRNSAGKLFNKIKVLLNSAYAPFAAFALLGIVALVTTVWLLQAESLSPLQEKVAETADKTDETVAIKEIIARTVPDNNFSVKRASDGSLKIVGHVRDHASKKKITEAIRKHQGDSSITIHVDSELLEAARKVTKQQLDPRNLKVSVLSVDNGHATISGAVSSLTIRDLLFERIRNEVAGILTISGALMLPEDLSAILQERIITSSFATRLQIVEKQPEFVVRGRVPEQDLPKLENLLSTFGSEYASLLPIRATIAVIRRTPPIDVQMVVGGATPFIVTADGQRVGKGGDSNGYILSTVGDQEVIFDGSDRFRLGR